LNGKQETEMSSAEKTEVQEVPDWLTAFKARHGITPEVEAKTAEEMRKERAADAADFSARIKRQDFCERFAKEEQRQKRMNGSAYKFSTGKEEEREDR
jgi:hypothetical protein